MKPGRTKRRRFPDECGGALVEAVVCLPLLLALLCGMIDLGQMALGHMSADDAAYAACRMLAADSGSSQQDLEKAAAAAAPMLSGSMTVSAETGPVKTTPYTHRLPSESGSFEERDSNSAFREVEVTVESSVEPMTAVGALLADAIGAEGGFPVKATRHATSDALVEGGASPW